MNQLIFLDNGATSFPKPEEVYRYMDQFYRSYGVNPGRSGYDLCLEAGLVVEETRKMLTEFFHGSDPNRLCFGYNSTDALNLIIFGMLRSGDHAITTTIEHNSVLRPLYHLSRQGVEVEHVPFDGGGFVDPAEIRKRFRPNTRLVIVNHASNVIGTVQPIAEIGRLCREAGIPFAIDASQSAGKVPIDMEAQNLDVVAFTGHKSLLGPMGIGGLCVREGVEIRHTRAGGTGVRSAVRPHLDEYPYRLEYGTPNIMGIAGLKAGLTWIKGQGLENIHAQEMRLAGLLLDGLKAIPRVRLYCQDSLENHIAVLAFNIEGMDAADVGTMLDVDFGIACRTGLHCAPRVHEQLGTDKIHGAVRFGIGPFNTEDHVRAAVQAVEKIAALPARKR
ncbi:MAG TPA: aminotransferase class V-fold PLP-dependent enzyme [Candidatus Aminicenantes bacterium]|nr:aminotransferase class V-fold PLP-dependent enzyme [Candidatus Aminicenantes bacterium]HRY65129.1 aminotransferase class V-fold PLP-dependent enzyme [Candidatus Aminicenantes bacterium]HRZ72403.1 aminotransferase class V-fold PLP-dependent enzyme [Candidatus Aminicenantes bacterium]